MKVKTIRAFKDYKENVKRELGEEFIVSKKRYEEINSTKFGKLVEEVKKEDK